MGIVELILHSHLPLTFTGALLLFCFVASVLFRSGGDSRGPPGPRALPGLGNLLQLDLRRPYLTLLKVRTRPHKIHASFVRIKSPSVF